MFYSETRRNTPFGVPITGVSLGSSTAVKSLDFSGKNLVGESGTAALYYSLRVVKELIIPKAK